MIYNKTEWVLVTTKWTFNYWNTDNSLEITPEVQKKLSEIYSYTQTVHWTQLSDAIFICI